MRRRPLCGSKVRATAAPIWRAWIRPRSWECLVGRLLGLAWARLVLGARFLAAPAIPKQCLGAGLLAAKGRRTHCCSRILEVVTASSVPRRTLPAGGPNSPSTVPAPSPRK